MQAAKGIPEKQAKVLRDAMAEPQPEDSEAHQIQQIEVSILKYSQTNYANERLYNLKAFCNG